jgi:hypothetical protein
MILAFPPGSSLSLAILDTLFARLGAPNTFTKAPQLIIIDDDTHTGLCVQQHSLTQSNPLQTWTDANGNILSSVSAGGIFGGNGLLLTNLNASNILNGTLLVGRGGTGTSSLTTHGVVIGQGTAAVHISSPGLSGQVFISNGASADPTFQTPGWVVAQGGTGDTSFTPYSLLFSGAVSTGALVDSGGPTTAGYVLTDNGPGAYPTFQAPAFTGTVTSVDASGGTTGLTFSGGPITTSGTLTLSGTLIGANGGTGSTHFTVAGPTANHTYTFPDASTTVLTTNAAVTVAQGGTGNASATAFSLITAGTTSTGAQQSIAIGTSGAMLLDQGAGALAAFKAMSGDATITAGGAITIAANAVTYAKMQNVSATSTLLGRGSASTGVPQEISLGSGLSMSGTTLSASGGTGTVTSVSGSGGTTGLTLTGGPITSSGTLTLGGTLIVANGGSGRASLTAHAVLLGEGTGNVAFATIGTAGNLLIDQGAGADPAFTAVSGAFTITSGGVATLATVNVATGGSGNTSTTAFSPICGGTTSTGAYQSVAIGTAGRLFIDQGAGALPAFVAASGAFTINSSGVAVLATVGVATGGTGLTSATAFAPILGGTTGTGAFQDPGVGTAGQVLTSNGPGVKSSWQAASGSGGTGGLAYMAAFTSPVSSNFSWLNQGSATEVATPGPGLLMTAPTNDGQARVRGRDKALANANPYTIIAAFVPCAAAVGQPVHVGIFVRCSGTGKITSFGPTYQTNGATQILVEHWTDANTASAAAATLGGGLGLGLIWLKIQDDGTNQIFSISNDGNTWCEVFQESRTTWFSGVGNTADHCGYFADPFTSTAGRGPIGLNLQSWVESNP